MAKFELRIYERYVTRVEVEAETAAQAIDKFMNDGGPAVVLRTEPNYLEMDARSGISFDDPDIDPSLPDALKQIDPGLVDGVDCYIPGLAGIRQIAP